MVGSPSRRCVALPRSTVAIRSTRLCGGLQANDSRAALVLHSAADDDDHDDEYEEEDEEDDEDEDEDDDA